MGFGLWTGVSENNSSVKGWTWARPDVRTYALMVRGLAASLRVSDAIKMIAYVSRAGVSAGEEVIVAFCGAAPFVVLVFLVHPFVVLQMILHCIVNFSFPYVLTSLTCKCYSMKLKLLAISTLCPFILHSLTAHSSSWQSLFLPL